MLRRGTLGPMRLMNSTAGPAAASGCASAKPYPASERGHCIKDAEVKARSKRVPKAESCFALMLAVAENHPPRVEMKGLKITHLERPKELAKRIDQGIDFGHAKLSQDGSDQHHLRLAKAGANISNFTGTGDWQNIKSKSLVGYHFGGFVSFFLGNNFAIQPEILFFPKFLMISHV